MRSLWTFGLALACVSSVAAQPAGKVVREYWDAAYLNGEKAGYSHTSVVEIVRNGTTSLRFTEELKLKFKSGRAVGQISDDHGDEETSDGRLLGVFRNIQLQNGQIKIRGQVVNGTLQLQFDNPSAQQVRQSVPLPEDFVTILGEQTFLQQKHLKPGERVSYRQFDPEFNTVIRVDVEAKDYQVVPLDGVNRKLLRVVINPEKIQDKKLPSRTVWYDEEFTPIRSQRQMQFAELTLVRTTQERATAVSSAPLFNLRDQAIVLNRTIERPQEQGTIVYRVIFAKETDEPAQAFKTGDNRQSVRNVSSDRLELVVSAVRNPPAAASTEKPDAEYLDSNHFVNSDDRRVRELAANAVGDETNPWKKAQLIEKWVKRQVTLRVTDFPSTADQVAKALTGDCKDVAILMAAMCRAQEIPSRTAIGLVYTASGGAPKLAYHMWTEVWINGQWLGLDATRGQGSVGPDHVKVTDHSWKDSNSLTPMLPVMNLMMARPRVEVLRVEREGPDSRRHGN
jgi:transglutaminase-like putative cysteine protease